MINVNEYFDGKVKSLNSSNKEGDATVGVIAPGTYEFGTSTIEVMTVIWGEFKVLLPGEEWKLYKREESFRVEKGQKFKVQVEENMSYLCQYL